MNGQVIVCVVALLGVAFNCVLVACSYEHSNWRFARQTAWWWNLLAAVLFGIAVWLFFVARPRLAVPPASQPVTITNPLVE